MTLASPSDFAAAHHAAYQAVGRVLGRVTGSRAIEAVRDGFVVAVEVEGYAEPFEVAAGYEKRRGWVAELRDGAGRVWAVGAGARLPEAVASMGRAGNPPALLAAHGSTKSFDNFNLRKSQGLGRFGPGFYFFAQADPNRGQFITDTFTWASGKFVYICLLNIKKSLIIGNPSHDAIWKNIEIGVKIVEGYTKKEAETLLTVSDDPVSKAYESLTIMEALDRRQRKSKKTVNRKDTNEKVRAFISEQLRANGFDAIMWMRFPPSGIETVVYDPAQIKIIKRVTQAEAAKLAQALTQGIDVFGSGRKKNPPPPPAHWSSRGPTTRKIYAKGPIPRTTRTSPHLKKLYNSLLKHYTKRVAETKRGRTWDEVAAILKIRPKGRASVALWGKALAERVFYAKLRGLAFSKDMIRKLPREGRS